MLEASYSEARRNLARLWDRVIEERDVVVVRRRGRERVAIIAADELAGLLETTRLLRSARNASRLRAALSRALKRRGRRQSALALRRELGLES